ncbi:hypothetical protein P4571_08460 [Niallia alba]|uniref:hypothetical protein n=1 Tax=Niallia alba TaxID=2729105 RepID=UPI002E2395DD|nr:hypothetical protein [Niallia alba]
MSEETIYQIANGVCKVIEDKRSLERENEYLRTELNKVYKHLRETNEENEEFFDSIVGIGKIFQI